MSPKSSPSTHDMWWHNDKYLQLPNHSGRGTLRQGLHILTECPSGTGTQLPTGHIPVRHPYWVSFPSFLCLPSLLLTRSS